MNAEKRFTEWAVNKSLNARDKHEETRTGARNWLVLSKYAYDFLDLCLGTRREPSFPVLGTGQTPDFHRFCQIAAG